MWIGVGSCILNMLDEKFPLELVGWKGFKTIKAYINGECRLHYLRLLRVDVSQFGKILDIFFLYINYIWVICYPTKKKKKQI